MLDSSLKEQLAGYLARLAQPIELSASLDDGDKSQELWSLLEDIASLSELITLNRADDNERRPSFAIKRVGTDVELRFAGLPMGHEFNSLVLALLQVGGHPTWRYRYYGDFPNMVITTKPYSGAFHGAEVRFNPR